MRTVELSPRDVYRSSDVSRWQIVKTVRQQSVAEHSYQVAMIAAQICAELNLTIQTRNAVAWFALSHDLPEVITGDLASPLKDLLGDEARDILELLEERMVVAGSGITATDRVRVIVKAADMMEAIKFLSENALTDHGYQVKANLWDRLKAMLDESGDMTLGAVCEHVLYKLLKGKETTLDDVVVD